MNQMKKVVGAVAFAAFGAWQALAGDIYRFEQITTYSEATPAYAGNQIAFRMVLDNRSDGATDQSANNFALVANPDHPTVKLLAQIAGASTFDQATLAQIASVFSDKPQLGIMVSGEERFADMEVGYYVRDNGTTNSALTVLNFTYTVQTGDYAYPFSPANSSGAFPTSTSSFEGYHFKNLATSSGDTVNPWALMNVDGELANLTFRDSGLGADIGVGESPAPNQDWYLQNNSNPIVIEGIGFPDAVSHDTANVWREVYEGLTDTYQSASPSVVIPGGVTASATTTLYVWVDPEDESAVTLDPAQSGIYNYNGTNILHLTIASGSTGASFSLKGVSQTGGRNGDGKAVIYASQFPGIRADIQGVQMSERLQRTVQCVEPPEPYISLVLRDGNGAETTTITAPAASDVRTPAATITVGLSQIPEADTTLKLTFTTPAATDGSQRDIRDYIGLSLNTQGNSFLDFTDEVTFAAGTEDLTKTINVFVYDGDELTRNNGITFSVAQSAGTPAYTPQATSYSLFINPFTPAITSPDDESTLGDTYQAGVAIPIDVTVNDTYFNSTNEYTVSVTGAAYDSSTPVVAANGVVTFGPKSYSTGTVKIGYTLTNKDGRSTAKRYVYANISEARTVSLTRVNEDLAEIAESSHRYAENGDADNTDPYYFRVALTENLAYGSAIYAFLVPSNESSTNALESIPSPVRIQPGSAASDSAFQLRFVDGNSGTSDLAYQVVLRTSDSETGNEFTDFNPVEFYVSVTNVPPSVPSTVYNGAIIMGANGQDRATCANVTVDSSTFTMVGNVSLNATKTFYVNQLLEPSLLDLAKTDGTGASTFQTRWSYWYNNQQLQVEVKNGNPLESDEGYTVTFNKAGTWAIQVECRDGDMGNNKWGPAYTFYVTVNPRPSISLTTGYTDERVDENATRVILTPTLSETADVDLDIAITITPDASDTNGSATPSIDTVTIPAGSLRPSTYPMLTLDGTAVSSSIGFSVTAAVTTDTLNADGVAYSDLYYQAAPAPMTLYVENKAPDVVQPVNTGTTNEVAIGAATKVAWRIKDVPADIAAGVTLHWTMPGGSMDVTVKPGEDPSDASTTIKSYGSNFITGETTFTFTASGTHVVTLQVEDKDQDLSTTRTLYYHCEESKALKLFAAGPGSGLTDCDAATPYHSAAGRGAGYLYSDGGAYVGASLFMSTYNFSVTARGANVYANGYKAGDVHNRDFNTYLDRDWGLGTSGYATAGVDPGSYYTASSTYDSFFYRWIQNNTSNSTGGSGSDSYIVSSPTPQMTEDPILLSANIAPGSSSQGGAVNYMDKLVEAVFSREFIASDNMGDINLDGIPDYFAVGSGPYSFALSSTDDDLASLANYNDDLKGDTATGDFLPAVDFTTNKAGRNILPALAAGWDTHGGAFTARLELRGFHDGLNNTGSFNGAMISDPDFSDAEFAAFTNYLATAGDTTAVTVSQTEQLDDNGDPVLDDDNNTVMVDVVSIDTNAVKSILASGAWTCENPTNPKSVDTDADGLPDGLEYFFWYHATVNDLHGRRFLWDDPSYGEAITPEEIIAVFNPTVRFNEATTNDIDGDGLTDLEEMAIGTNPIDWDTDGDYLPDGWEVMWGLNPLAGGGAPYNPNLNPDGDAMAFYNFASYGSFTIVHKNGVGCVAVEGDVDITAAGSATGIKVLYNPVRGEFVPCGFAPGGEGGRHVMAAYGTYQKSASESFTGVTIEWTDDEIAEAAARGDQLLEKFSGKSLTLIHQQVRAYLGYDPRTGWYINATGHVNGRWGVSDGRGEAVNTRAFQNYDEFFAGAYLQLVEGYSPTTTRNEARKVNVWHNFLDNTTCPTPDHTTNAYIETLLAALDASADWNQVVHGADTNGDGVPDGWALYTGRNAVVGIVQADQLATAFDDDGLALVAEYSGTDSCAAYSGVDSIYSTWNARWANKFFPTDPDDADTDGDGVKDGAEGGTFSGIIRVGSSEYAAATPTGYWLMSSIPGSGTCFQGGGMNPCSIDTDADGLPDPWEAQYIGRLMRADGKWFVADQTPNITFLPDSFWVMNGLNDPDHTYASSTNANPTVADDLYNGNNIATVHPPAMMVAGMDPTWEGDASTYVTGSDNREVTGRAQTIAIDGNGGYTTMIREVDFDADGLQNFQEYMVQALRHLRYDDTATPLMGRFLGESSTTAYVTFNPYDETLYKYALQRQGFDEAKIDAIDFKSLGYFVDPPKAWDKSTFDGFRYMFAPAATYKYVSSDPRNPDTDNDGMDDYYEIFHGLNPLYGKDPDERVALVYGGVDGIDVIYNAAYASVEESADGETTFVPVSAKDNAWTRAAGYASGEYVPYNSVRFPWLSGSPYADPDGDGLKNKDEAILPNETSPRNYHTDPSPLWFTDPSGLEEMALDELHITTAGIVTNYYRSANPSLVSQYYVRPPELALAPYAAAWCWREAYATRWIVTSTDTLSNTAEGTYEGSSGRWMYAFEANEGFDTDADWRSDVREKTPGVEGASDPQKFTDLDRRQALWFPGENAVAVTREPGYRAISQADLLKQFTVECWVKPDELRDSVILERATWVTASNSAKTEGKVRANFRIATTPEGNVYGVVESADAVDSESDASTAIVQGPVLSTEDWTHLALSYNGSVLSLYINGTLYSSKGCTLIPANGVGVQIQNHAHIFDFPVDEYHYTASALLIGAQAKTAAALLVSSNDYVNVIAPAWSDYQRFYKGYVDEVRIWDGVRTATEIKADYTKRYSFDDVYENRETVYESWASGASRYLGNLPPELVQHYNFASIPGAVDSGDVAQTPSGFEQAVPPNVGDGTADISVWWWKLLADAGMGNTVYADTRVVPWIQNTVQHLPAMDGSARDSFYYGQYYAGYEAPLLTGVTAFDFPNTADPYGWSNFLNDRLYRWRRLTTLAALRSQDDAGVDYATCVKRLRYQLRTDFVGTSDMIPLGGAFAKRADSFWDGQGAMDAWADTVEDTDGDGLPDWWEDMYGLSNSEDSLKTMVDYDWGNGTISITAAEAYLRDLAKGMLPSGSKDTAYIDIVDSNTNGLPDWWETLYGLASTTGDDDSDSDGLSNRAEYLISEIFQYYMLDPTLPRTPDENNGGETMVDFFKKVGELYLGDMFDDHDKVEGAWEANYAGYVDSHNRKFMDGANYDASGDLDADGWSNWSEARAGKAPVRTAIIGIDGDELEEYPIPVITMSTYSPIAIGDGNLIVKSWAESTLGNPIEFDHAPDAVWTIANATEQVDREKYVGMNPGKVIKFNLGPGNVRAGTIRVRAKDPAMRRGVYNSGAFTFYADQAAIVDPSLQFWTSCVADVQRTDGTEFGDLVFYQGVAETGGDDAAAGGGSDYGTVVGWVNYVTGEAEVDFSKISGYQFWYWNSTTSSWISLYAYGDYAGTYYSGAYATSLSRSYMKMSWQTKRTSSEKSGTYYLSYADSGHVKEGLNTFEVVADRDGDGVYTPGRDLYGIARNVDVGYESAKFNVELLEVSPIFDRVDILNGVTDRGTLYGTDSGDYTNLVAGVLSGGTKQVVKVVRTMINYTACSDIVAMYPDAFPGGTNELNEVVMQRIIDFDNRTVLTERDFLSDDVLDIDWNNLTNINAKLAKAYGQRLDITNVAYRIVLGNGSTAADNYNNLFQIAVTRTYDGDNFRDVPVPLAPASNGENAIVYASHPTFVWTTTNMNSYTAFQIQVKNSSGTTVWDSGVQPMPKRDALGRYVWEAPLYAGDQALDTAGKGAIFGNLTNYTWRVRVMNAKFQDALASEEGWSEPANGKFRMNVNGTKEIHDGGYSSIAVAVKYRGPSQVLTARGKATDIADPRAKVRVQAFSTADFTGIPVSQGVLLDMDSLTNSTETANTVLGGLPDGTYYIRAYIDSDGDMKRSKWESWGYANAIADPADPNYYTPAAVVIDASTVKAPEVTVWIDDCDTDGDWLPDAWEYAQGGNLLQGPAQTTADDAFAWYVNINPQLQETVKNRLTDSLSGATFAILSTPQLAALALGAQPEDASVAAAKAAILAIVSPEVEADGISIDSIEIDSNGIVYLAVSATAGANGEEAVSSGPLSSPAASTYELTAPSTYQLDCKILYTDDLSKPFVQLGDVRTITVVNGAVQEEFAIEMDTSSTAGFFKAEFTKHQ